MEDEQIKLHPNPMSKEGLGRQVMDMGLAIAKLSTDMEWVKKTLAEIKETLDKSNEEFEEAIKSYQAQVNQRLDDHERRIKELEAGRSWLKGAIAGLSVVTFILSLIQLLKLLQ